MNLLAEMNLTKSARSIQWSTLIAVLALSSTQAFAQYNNDQRYDSAEYVGVYEHCDVRGERREVPVGEHRSLKNLRIANDSISSIEVPRGLDLIVFEDSNLRGQSARISRDVACLDRDWNDRVSSMDVAYNRSSRHGSDRDGRDRDGSNRYDDDRYNNNQYENRRNNDRYENSNRNPNDNRDYQNHRPNTRSYENRRGANIPRNGNNPNRIQNANGVTAKNVASVSFAGVALTKTGKNRWTSTSSRARAKQYRETSRGDNAVFLEYIRSSEKIRIDLFTNQVTMITRNGRQNSFPITAKQAEIAPQIVVPARQTVGVINNRCFTYKAYTLGGSGGIRFHGHDGFHQFANKGHSERICHDGALTAEINKVDANTRVVLEIEGKKYVFAANEKADSYKNNWYRKLVKLTVR
jgi:hypothetical protein